VNNPTGYTKRGISGSNRLAALGRFVALDGLASLLRTRIFESVRLEIIYRMNDSAPADATPSATPDGRVKWLNVVLAVADPLSIAALYVYMLAHSWLGWMDPFIDVPRELYTAWRMSEGDLLYDRIACWYGPLAELVQAAGFRVFGVGLDTMVWMNIILTAGVLLLLRSVFRTLGSRLMGWLAPVVFLCVFAFGHYNSVANYNFILPYTAQSTYSFFGLLLLLWGLLKHLKKERSVWLWVAGLGLAVTYLDKPEALLAAAGALGVYLFVQSLRLTRHEASSSRWLWRALGLLTGGFFCLWLPVFGFFLCKAGLSYAIRATDYVLVSLLDSQVRNTLANSRLFQLYFGFDKPWENFLYQLRVGGCLVLVCGVMVVAARPWVRTRRLGPKWWILLMVVIMAAGTAGLLAESDNRWLNIGSIFVFPVCLATAAFFGRSVWSAWHGCVEFNRVLGVAVVGMAASLMLVRIILSGRLSHYGFYLMPLAVLFWIHLMVVEAAWPLERSPQTRTNWLLPATFSALALYGSFTLAHFNLGIYAMKDFAVGEGHDRFYTFSTKNGEVSGVLLQATLDSYAKKTPTAKTLVAFPEGIMVNYLLRVPTPVKEQEFLSMALGFTKPESVLEELKAHPPEVVYLMHRDYAEYGLKYFGEDEASGRAILLWLNENYKIIGTAGESKHNVTGHYLDLLVPKNTPLPPGAPSAPLLPEVQ